MDDLGRVVIPKEIRRTLRVPEGSPLEIFTRNGKEIVLKKYSPLFQIDEYASDYADAIRDSIQIATFICDEEEIVAASGLSKKKLVKTSIPDFVRKAYDDKSSINEHTQVEIGDETFSHYAVVPFVQNNELRGSIVLVANRPVTDNDMKIAEICASFFANQFSDKKMVTI
jgi:AbrB family transcriptional regulator (stage V sporulation protein T)